MKCEYLSEENGYYYCNATYKPIRLETATYSKYQQSPGVKTLCLENCDLCPRYKKAKASQ